MHPIIKRLVWHDSRRRPNRRTKPSPLGGDKKRSTASIVLLPLSCRISEFHSAPRMHSCNVQVTWTKSVQGKLRSRLRCPGRRKRPLHARRQHSEAERGGKTNVWMQPSGIYEMPSASQSVQGECGWPAANPAFRVSGRKQ